VELLTVPGSAGNPGARGTRDRFVMYVARGCVSKDAVQKKNRRENDNSVRVQEAGASRQWSGKRRWCVVVRVWEGCHGRGKKTTGSYANGLFVVGNSQGIVSIWTRQDRCGVDAFERAFVAFRVVVGMFCVLVDRRNRLWRVWGIEGSEKIEVGGGRCLRLWRRSTASGSSTATKAWGLRAHFREHKEGGGEALVTTHTGSNTNTRPAEWRMRLLRTIWMNDAWDWLAQVLSRSSFGCGFDSPPRRLVAPTPRQHRYSKQTIAETYVIANDFASSSPDALDFPIVFL